MTAFDTRAHQACQRAEGKSNNPFEETSGVQTSTDRNGSIKGILARPEACPPDFEDGTRPAGQHPTASIVDNLPKQTWDCQPDKALSGPLKGRKKGEQCTRPLPGDSA